METKEQIIKIVDELNENIPDECYHRFQFSTDGFVSAISFADFFLWNSYDEIREYIEDTNDYEDLKTFIIKQFKKTLKQLNEIEL